MPEYAKELVWEGNPYLLSGSLRSQTQLFPEQNWRLERLVGKVSVVVTDSPILLGLIYCKELTPTLESQIMEAYRGYNNFNLFILREEGFDQAGRIHTLEQSRAIDKRIHAMLKSYDIFYGTYDRDKTDVMIANIKRSLQYNRSFAEQPTQVTRPKPRQTTKGR